jgi:hypothetical protein
VGGCVGGFVCSCGLGFPKESAHAGVIVAAVAAGGKAGGKGRKGAGAKVPRVIRLRNHSICIPI